jgi:hypothetical protein
MITAAGGQNSTKRLVKLLHFSPEIDARWLQRRARTRNGTTIKSGARVCTERNALVCFRVYGLEKKQNPKPRKAHHGIFFKKLSRFGIKNNTRTRTEYTSDHRGVF